MGKRRSRLALAAVVAGVIPAAAGCVSQGQSGTLSGRFFNRLRPAIRIDQVWCGWGPKNRVIDVHIRIRNTGRAGYTLRWQAGGMVQGENGTDDSESFTRFLTTPVPGSSTVTEEVAVPIPRDVQPGAGLISCVQQLDERARR